MVDKPSLKILIVDDENSSRSLAIQCLDGHEKRVAANCEEARDVYERFKPHLVFLDINLPDGNGLNLLSDMLGGNQGVYVVMVSANRRVRPVRDAMTLGAKGYIAKPFNKKSLLQHVDRCIEIIGAENLKNQSYGDDPIEIVNDNLRTEIQPSLNLTDVYKNWRVLFADSYYHNCEAAKRAFQELDSQVITVQDGEAAWRLLQHASFQLIFVETQLPQRNGYDLTRLIREKEHGDEFHSYIIGMHPDSASENKKWLYAGMNECISKPINLSGLQKIAERYATSYYKDFYPLLERLIKANEFYPDASSTLADYQKKVDDYAQDIADFKHIVGHALRDPFFDIYDLYREMLKSTAEISKDDVRKMLPPLEKLLGRLESLKEYLDLKGFNPKLSVINLADIVKKIIAEIQPDLDAKKAKIKLDGFFPHIVGNERLLSKLLRIVIDNALRFSGEGAFIKIDCKETPENFIISVEDNGSGIDPLHTKLAFRPFYHMDPTGQGRDGNGMGLAIARQIVELHGGKIWLESLEPSGTLCSFYLSKRSQIT